MADVLAIRSSEEFTKEKRLALWYGSLCALGMFAPTKDTSEVQIVYLSYPILVLTIALFIAYLYHLSSFVYHYRRLATLNSAALYSPLIDDMLLSLKSLRDGIEEVCSNLPNTIPDFNYSEEDIDKVVAEFDAHRNSTVKSIENFRDAAGRSPSDDYLADDPQRFWNWRSGLLGDIETAFHEAIMRLEALDSNGPQLMSTFKKGNDLIRESVDELSQRVSRIDSIYEDLSRVSSAIPLGEIRMRKYYDLGTVCIVGFFATMSVAYRVYTGNMDWLPVLP